MSELIIPANVTPPPEAHNFQPTPRMIMSGTGKNAQRYIFHSQELTPFENEKLSRLEAELKKDKINPFELHPNWTRNDLLRFCYGTGWKTRNSKETLLKYLKWHKGIMPNGYLGLYSKSLRLLV
jgi:hypothetical protein